MALLDPPRLLIFQKILQFWSKSVKLGTFGAKFHPPWAYLIHHVYSNLKIGNPPCLFDPPRQLNSEEYEFCTN